MPVFHAVFKVCQAENGSQGNCAVGAHGRVDLDCAQLMHALSTNSADSTGISHSYDEIQPLPAGRESMATTETEEMQEPPQSHGTGSHTTAAQADQIEGESWNNLPVEIADAAYLDGTLDAAAHPVQSEPMNGEPQGYFAPTESEQMGTDQCIQGLFLHVEGPGLEAEHQSQQADGTLAAGHDARPAQSEQIEAELPGNHNASAELEGEVSAASHGSIHVETAPNLPQQEQTGHGETQNQSDPAQPVQVEVEPQSSQTVFESQESGQVDDKPETGDDATAAQADQIEGESWNNLPVEIADAAYLDGTLDAAAHPVQSEPMNGEPQGYFAPTESEQMGTDQCIQGLFLHVEGPGLEAEHQSQQADGTLAAGHDARPAQSEQIEAELPGNHNASAELEGEVSAASHGSIHVETAPNLPQQEQTGHGETQNQSDPAQPVQVEVEPQSSQTVFESQESGQVDDKPETGDDATAAQADQIEGESWNNLPVEIADAAYLDGTLEAAAAHPVQSEPMNGEPQGYFAPTESEQMGTDQCIQGLFLHVEGPGLEAEHQSQQADGTLAAGHDARPAQSEKIEAELPGNHNPSAEFEPEQIWEDLEGMHESANVGEILCESDAKPSQLVQAQGYLQNTSLYASGENELPEAHAQAHSHMHQPGQSALEEASETSHGIHAGAFPTDAQPGLQQLQQHWTPAALSPDAEQEASEAWHGSMCVDEMPPSHAETDQGQERPQIHASLHEFVLSGPVLSDPETQMQVQALQVAGFSQQDIVPHDVAVGSWTTIQQPPWLPTQAANSLSVCGCSHSDSVSAGKVTALISL